MSQLILSLFPGIGLLDMAFEEAGFCVVRGPDLLWGGDVKRFHPPAGKFDGVIGGPPCQAFSPLANLSGYTENLIPEFERVVRATRPAWFLMENVREAPLPEIDGFKVCARLLNNRHLGQEQNRVRRFSFGTHDGRPLHFDTAALEAFEWKAAVTAAHGGERRTHFNKGTGGQIPLSSAAEALRLQGLAADFFEKYKPHSPITKYGQLKLLAQGVPLPMGRAVAAAVKRALGLDDERSAA